ncbi:MAG: hypothetical protein KKC76_11235 [Proteobacteria bacterium]|nr:hypothetical protein [Pseudomonadota bacterium]MBU4296756.1 hypothetical protein [Pseudomonadota bacterium]MCG2745930.1 hypothetical protein [Desulfobulbaceae bacterium]
MIAGFLDWRAKNLETGIKNLLTDTKQPGLEQNFYKHPMIRSLCRHKTDGRKPSYIPPHTFSLVLLDLIVPDEGKSKTVESIRQSIKQLPDQSPLRRNLLLLLDDSQDNLDHFHRNIETWYNNAMDRISGWYKRKAQAVSLIIAFLVSFSLNADTFQIAKSLANDPVMRQAIVKQAQEMTQKSQAAPENGEAGGSVAPKSLEEIKNELDKTGLPFGWQNAQVEKMNNDGLLAWFTKLAGLLITTLAVSLGAPFWFDVLNKITNIRSAGPIERKKK